MVLLGIVFSDLKGSPKPSDGQVLNITQAVKSQPCAASLGAGKGPILFRRHCCFQIANTLDRLSMAGIIQVVHVILTTDTLVTACPTHSS